MSRRLKTIARGLEAQYPELRVSLGKWTSSTDGHVAGTREGKGRIGTLLQVYYQLDKKALRAARDTVQALYAGYPKDQNVRDLVIHSVRPLFEHRAGDTYRNNSEVERWVEEYATCKRGRHRKFFCESKEPDLCFICQRVRVL